MNKQDREKANLVFEALTKKLPGSYIEDGPAIAKVSTVGAGMAFKVGTAGKIFLKLIIIEFIKKFNTYTILINTCHQSTTELNALNFFI